MTPAERAHAIAMQAKADIPDQRQRNRERMPEAAILMDIVKRYDKPVWGKLTENGYTVEWGKRTVFGKSVALSAEVADVKGYG